MIFIVAASVFLCLLASCGIPRYLTEVDATITSNSDLVFNLHFQSDSDSAESDKVGLFLLYFLSDTTNPVSVQTLNTQFKNKYRPTQYDGINVSVEENTPVLSYNVSDNKFEFYAFETESRVVQAPLYTYQIDDNPGNYIVELSYNPTSKSITMVVKNSLLLELATETLYLHDDFEPSIDCSNVLVYGAVCINPKNYSNIYWSDFKQCGTVSVYEQ